MADWFGDRHDEVQRTREDAAIDQAIGTLERPQAELRVDAPKQEGETLTDLKLAKPPSPGTPAERVQGEAIVPAQGEAQAQPFEPGVMHDKKRKEFTVEPPEVQAIRQQYKDELAKIMSGETVVEEVGKAGRKLAEALHPGIRTAAIALGLDETGADALATGFVEFAAGLPGTEESDLVAGVETALATLPMVGAAIAGGKFVAGKAPAIISEALRLLHEERGSVPVSGMKSGAKSSIAINPQDDPSRFMTVREDTKGTAKTYEERNYKTKVKVRVEWDNVLLPDASSSTGGKRGKDVIEDEMDGLNVGHALRRAADNWVTADRIQVIGIADSDKRSAMQLALDILKSERGSISFGKGKQEVAAQQKAIPTWEQAINLDEADRSFQTLLKDHKDRLSKQRRGVREDVVVGAEADELQQSKMAWEHVLEIPPGTILPDSEVKALAKTFEAHTQPTIDLAKYIQANPQDMDAKVALLQQLGDVERGLNAVAGVYAETGRAERMLNRRLPIPREVDPKTAEQIRIADPYIQQWLEFFDKQKALADIGLPSKSIDDLATIVSSLKTPREVAKLVKDMRDGRLSVGDWWSAWVYFSALSNPATHMANLSGLPLMATTTVVERALARKIGPEAARSVIEDDRLGLGVVSGEAHQMMLGAVNGIHNAIATSAAIAEQGAAFATGKSAAQRTAAEKVQGGLGGFAALLNAIESGEAGKLTEAGVSKPIRQITAARSGYDGMLGDIVDTIGMTIEAPKMALAAEDAFMKTVFRDMQRGALAHRLATFRAGESVGPVYEREFSNLMEHPTIGMLKEMDEFAERNTFSKSLEGRMASFEHAFGSPAMKPFVMFIKTAARIAEEGAQRTPLLGLLTQQLRDDIAAGGSRRALATAKIHYGAGVALVATALSLEGRISGNGPANPAMKAVWDTEYLPLSFRINGIDYQFGRNDPVALWMGHMADFVTMMRDLPDAVAQDMAIGYTMAFVNNMASKTFAQSTSEFFGLFKRRANETSQEQATRVRHYLEGQAARVAVPGILYAVDRAYFDNVMRETRSLAEKTAGRTPGYSQDVPPNLNYWGEVETYETFGPEILSHIRVRKALNDPVNLEVLKQKAELPNIPKIVDGQEVTAQEAYELRLLFAKGITTSMYGSGPVNLHEALSLTMQQPWYKDAPGPAENNLFRATALRSVATDYLSAAMQEMAKKYPKFLRLSKELELHQQMTGIPKEETLQQIQEQLTR